MHRCATAPAWGARSRHRRGGRARAGGRPRCAERRTVLRRDVCAPRSIRAATTPAPCRPPRRFRHCAETVTQLLSTLAHAVRRCHRTAAIEGLPPGDPAVRRRALRGRGARAVRYGQCPSACRRRLSTVPRRPARKATLADAVVARLDATNVAAFPCPDPVLHPGAVQLDRPTLIALGVQWLISGDANHNAGVTVRYRQVGAPAWHDALPLFRVRPETVPDHIIPEQFAGSIFDLRPATTYEIELHATDADGGVDETRTLSGDDARGAGRSGEPARRRGRRRSTELERGAGERAARRRHQPRRRRVHRPVRPRSQRHGGRTPSSSAAPRATARSSTATAATATSSRSTAATCTSSA